MVLDYLGKQNRSRRQRKSKVSQPASALASIALPPTTSIASPVSPLAGTVSGVAQITELQSVSGGAQPPQLSSVVVAEPLEALSGSFHVGFVGRNDQLSYKRTEPLEKARADVTKEKVEAFVKIFLQELVGFEFVEMWNADELGVSGDLRRRRFAYTSKALRTHHDTLSALPKEHITLLGCCSNKGRVMPPLLLVKGKKKTRKLSDALLAESNLQVTENGWISKKVFTEWFGYFLDTIERLKDNPDRKWHLLILDGHKSHILEEYRDLGREERVLVCILPSHCSHILQPCDLAWFGPMKQRLARLAAQWRKDRPNATMTRFDLMRLMQEAYYLSATVSNIEAAWRKSGFFPWDPQRMVNSRAIIEPSVPAEDAVLPQDPSSTAVSSSSVEGLCVYVLFACMYGVILSAYSALYFLCASAASVSAPMDESSSSESSPPVPANNG